MQAAMMIVPPSMLGDSREPCQLPNTPRSAGGFEAKGRLHLAYHVHIVRSQVSHVKSGLARPDKVVPL